MQVGTVSCTISTNDTKAFVFVADRTANTVAVRTACSVTLVLPVLNSEVQAINQTKEVGVTIGSNAANTTNEEVIAVCSITTKFWQHIGVTQCIINHTVVTAVIERTNVSVFKTRECQTRFVTSLSVSAFKLLPRKLYSH